MATAFSEGFSAQDFYAEPWSGTFDDPRPSLALVDGDRDRQIRADERSRIGRELHDSTAQLLVALQLQTLYAKEMLDEPQPRAALAQIEQTLGELHRQVRTIAFLNEAPILRPGMLRQALASMADRFEQVSRLRITFVVARNYRPVSDAIEGALYRIAQEALANVHRHARATTVNITLHSTADGVRLTVKDNGLGISPSRDASRPSGMGIRNMRSRARELGGRVSITNSGGGTRLAVAVPLRAATS